MSRIFQLPDKYQRFLMETRIIMPKYGPGRAEYYLAKSPDSSVCAYISLSEDKGIEFNLWTKFADSAGYLTVSWGVFDEYFGF